MSKFFQIGDKFKPCKTAFFYKKDKTSYVDVAMPLDYTLEDIKPFVCEYYGIDIEKFDAILEVGRFPERGLDFD